MKQVFLLPVLMFLGSLAAQAAKVVVSANITGNTTWEDTNVYYLNAFIYVKNATLTIKPGTLIRGVKANKGTLIVTKTGKIIAQGTAQKPIVFTSDQAPGSRNYGDWGGVIILGKAPTNSSVTVGGTPIPGIGVIEGGVNNASGDGEYGAGANADPNDSSGVFSYVRIEFPGIAFQPNNEINGLTLGGVGAKTVIDHVQVSYSGDDSYEWFGGTVNAKYMIAYRGWDDDFDTDNGYIGKVQFGLAFRDSAIADISGSNGFESDNDASGSSTAPFTAPVFSNMTIVGPRQSSGTTLNSNFKRSMHLRRNTRTSVFNSVFMGWPTGLLLDGSACESNATNGDLELQNVTIAGCATNFALVANSTFTLAPWFATAANNNDSSLSFSAVGLTDPYTYNAPNLKPTTTSPLLGGASFTATKLNDPFFTTVTYRGALDNSNDWTSNWTNWNPQATVYEPTIEFPLAVSNNTSLIDNFSAFPNPAKNLLYTLFTAKEHEDVQIKIIDLNGRVQLTQNTSALPGANKKAIDISALANATYIVKVYANNMVLATQKISVQK